MALRMTSPAMPSRSTSTTYVASSAPNSSLTSRAGDTASKSRASRHRPWSLRRRLALAAAGAACLVFIFLGVLVHRAVTVSTDQQFDEMLKERAILVLRYADHEYAEGDSLVPPGPSAQAIGTLTFEVVFQVVTPKNELLYRSPGAPLVPLTIRGGTAAGFSDAYLEGRAWRVYALASEASPLAVYMAEPLAYRKALLSRTARAVAIPLILALVLLAALIGLVTERALRPVRRLAADLDGRAPDDLSEVDTDAMPLETHPLGTALNGLLARQAQLLARERRFTADAAHELRTPLAALRAQAQVVARSSTPVEMRYGLEKLQLNIDRTTHLINQLLALARLEPAKLESIAERTQAKVVIDLVLDDLAGTAREKQLALQVSGWRCSLPGSSELLYLLMRNLLENAIRHAPRQGHVQLTVSANQDSASVVISDDGPGIPVAERERAFERFYRIPGNESAGSGLGLSIVGGVVQLLGGTVTLADPPSGTGLVVTVRLPV